MYSACRIVKSMLSTAYLILTLLLTFPLCRTSAFPTANPPPPLTLTTLKDNSTPTSNLTTVSISDWHCVRLSPFSKCPRFWHCLHAISNLPSFARTDSFHNFGPRDPYLLPVRRTHETCTVRVELNAFTSTEAGSWRSIQQVAAGLSRYCLKGNEGMFGLYKAAWTTSGKKDRIVITVENSGLDRGKVDGGYETE